jgi:hypothetical protein
LAEVRESTTAELHSKIDKHVAAYNLLKRQTDQEISNLNNTIDISINKEIQSQDDMRSYKNKISIILALNATGWFLVTLKAFFNFWN